ncbi:8-amino-7-oxononanoate synthase [candidate division WOR-3 bacterium]|nr:8-amino-7-oxononanoate synthase [candidate division WOR-3 bacterium]
MGLFDKCRETVGRVEYTKTAGQYFYLRVFEPPATPVVKMAGREMLMLGSNNYLGLANHPKVVQAAVQALKEYGTGACSSRILTGSGPLHDRLEKELARFKGTEAAVLFSTGFMTMTGAITALTGEGDVILSDELNHASIVDGCRLSRAVVRVYRHNDMVSLEKALVRARSARGRLIVTDGVFSMRGAVANLPEIRRLADRHDAALMVDDAHGSGVLGEHGRGVLEHYGMEGRVELVCGTFSKTFATTGGFVAASREVVTYLSHAARPFIFTASPAPVTVATVLAGLEVLAEEPGLLADLHRNARFMKEELGAAGFRLEPTITPIVPILIGSDEKTFQMAGRLEDEGVIVNPIVPPAVSSEGSLIRVSVMATFTLDQLGLAVERFKKAGRLAGVI